MEILRYCFESGRRERGIFQLTVPTGGGKTIASLAFALQHAVENDMRDRKAMYCRWCNDSTWEPSTQDEFEETDKILKEMGY